MYVLPILLALAICALIGMGIVYLDNAEERSTAKGRLDQEQEARIAFQEEKRRQAIEYVSYRFKR